MTPEITKLIKPTKNLVCIIYNCAYSGHINRSSLENCEPYTFAFLEISHVKDIDLTSALRS